MERIHNLLRKIQDIYYKKEEKQVIDIDLMLDYARVLYADLLDARTDILAKQGMGLHLKEQQPTEKTAPKTEEEVVAFANDEQELLHATVDEDNDEIEEETPTETTTEIEEEVGAAQQAEAAEALEHIEATVTAAETEPEPIPEQEEKQLDLSEEIRDEKSDEAAEDGDETEENPLREDDEPATEEEVAEFAAEQIVETEPKPRNQVVINDDDYPSLSVEEMDNEEPPVFSEIHFELPEVKDKASESPKQGFLFQKHTDIRSFIGINDKYQFMNELFANNRTAYEESLDKLSGLETFAAAKEWLLDKALPQHNWNKEDETFQSLLQTTKKFFDA